MKKLAAIICTKDRPFDLERLLISLQNQTRLLDKIIIIDGSDNPVENVVRKFDLNIHYETLRPPGLTRQRNLGLGLLPSEIDWVGFMDDDLELESKTIENLENFISRDEALGGVGLVINNQPTFKPHFYRTLFMTDLEPGGKITKSGAAAAIRPVKEDLEVEWLYGGATFWKTSIIKSYKFDEWFSGVGYMEDVDFSYRVSRDHKLMLCSKARCMHHYHPRTKEKLFKHGTWHVVSWWYFVRKNSEISPLLALWSMFGLFISNLGFGLFKPSTHRIRAALGNLNGLKMIMTGEYINYQGYQK